MSAKKMTAQEKEISNALIRNLEMLKKEKKISTDKEIIEKLHFVQSKYSAIINGHNLPTMMELIALADFYDVSIDFLLGRKTEKSNALSLRDVCQNIALIKSGGFGAEFTKIEIEECCMDNSSGYPHSYKNTYQALYFSEENDGLPFNDWKNNAQLINNFIRQFLQIYKMKCNDDLTSDMYNRLLETYLADVEKKKKELYDDDNLPFNIQKHLLSHKTYQGKDGE